MAGMLGRSARQPARKTTHERREEIADVAMRILARDGHRRLTSKAIAAEVGITEGAIFRHFPTMEAIADAIVERMGDELASSLERTDDNPLDRLRAFFRHRAALLGSKPDVARLLLTDHLAQAAGEAHAAKVDAFRRKSQRLVLECLTEAKARKLLAASVPIESAMRLVMGALMSIGHGVAPLPAGKLEETIDGLWHLIDRALRGKESAR
jgi:TetR/AcrR family transcriptional regulator